MKIYIYKDCQCTYIDKVQDIINQKKPSGVIDNKMYWWAENDKYFIYLCWKKTTTENIRKEWISWVWKNLITIKINDKDEIYAYDRHADIEPRHLKKIQCRGNYNKTNKSYNNVSYEKDDEQKAMSCFRGKIQSG